MLRDFIALTKPGVTAQVVMTTAGGLWLAGGAVPSVWIACLVGTALIVGSANTLNCYIERSSDGLMQRTRLRPLPAGRLQPAWALAFGLLLGLLATPLLVWGVNPLCGFLGAFALVTYAGIYTPLKRRTAWALSIGAVPGAVPPLLGWAAATGQVDATGWVLFAVLFVWQHPHFLAIALRRHTEYTAAGLRTVVGALGMDRTARLALISAILLVPTSLALVPLGVAGLTYGVLVTAIGAAWVARALATRRTDDRMVWARRFFKDSLLYLTAVFAALPLDAWVG